MKLITRYTIRDEEDNEYASFLNPDTAFDWLEIANAGGCLKQNWRGKKYHLVKKSVEISENTGTLFF